MVKRKVVISERDNIATLLEDDRAVEFIIHRGDMLLGDVYLAQVENILPSIDAAFVNVGGDKMGFLHSSDVPGKGDLKTRLQPKQQLVVQVMKEPTGHKGPRVTTDISLPGRFLVLMPESKGISISRKIEDAKERSRLKSVVSMIKPPGVGVIIRTEADGQKEADVQEDFEILMERWQNIVTMADTAKPPTLLYRDQDLLYRVIRESVTEDIGEIILDSAFGQQRAQQLLQNWNMEKNIKVTLYQGNQHILVGTGVDKEIKLALQTKVPLPSGGYLYIQPTEALCVIDVNSGKFTSLESQAETIRLTNLEATKEIARQLRLRNIGGMIIVDFIDMESRANQLSILEAFENELAPDKSKPQIGQLSDLGLVEMTRHRQGQALSEIFTKRCTHCNGTGNALEDFHWSSPSIDGSHSGAESPGRPHGRDGRGRQFGGGRDRHDRGGRDRGERPDRNDRGGNDRGGHPRHQQQQIPRPQASLRRPVQKVIPLSQMLEIGRPEAGKAGASAYKPGELLKKGASPTKTFSLTEHTLADYFQEKTLQQLGANFSVAIKCAHTPPGANSILTRINPKSNDILTLVASIEGNIGGSVRVLDEDEGDTDQDEEMMDDAQAGDEAEDDEDSDNGRRRGGGRHHQQRRGPRHHASVGKDDQDDEDSDDVAADEAEDDDQPRRKKLTRSPLAGGASDEEFEAMDDDGDDADIEDSEDGDGDQKPRRRRGRPPKRTKSENDDEDGDNDDDDGSGRKRRPAPATSSLD